MHDLFAQVLNKKDLSKAGDLFSLEDKDIQSDLGEVLKAIGEIADTSEYATNNNDQSVVEICITRVTTAIRETNTIDEHSVSLVKLLEMCQRHDLNPSPQDPPHAKIASDIMSCLFTHYSKAKVMSLAIPVVVNFLSRDNKELCTSVSSYLSLAALDNADLLAVHMNLIVQSILRGNYVLSTVLPQIFTQNSKPIIDSTEKLVKVIDICEPAERVSLFQVFGMIGKSNSKILEPHIAKCCEFLSVSTLCPLILSMFVDMATSNPQVFVEHIETLKQLGEKQPGNMVQIIQIIGAIGTINEDHARKSMDYFISQLGSSDQTALTVTLQEVKALSVNHSSLLTENIEHISKLSQSGSSAVRLLVQQLKDDQKKYSVTTVVDSRKTRSVSSQTEGAVTIITVGNPPSYPSNVVAVKQTGSPPSNMSSQQSLGKSSRNSASNAKLYYERPGSPVSTIISDRMSMSSAMTVGSTQTGPTLPAEPVRDGVQHFCEKHMQTIRNFISHIAARIPLPCKCNLRNGKHKKFVQLSFLCGGQGDQCLYGSACFTLNTKIPKTWIHLMFLTVQAQSTSALSQQDPNISNLKTCWDALRTERGSSSFLTLVTSSFPSARDQDALLQELHSARFFDVFEFNAVKKHWACFMCNHPEKVYDYLQDGNPVIAGQLKEKKGRWKFLKRWKTRYFTLSGAQITYSKSDSRKETLPVSKIQSVKAVRKGIRDIPKAFEIFTGDETYTFKAKGQQNIQQWVQCLHIAVARVQKIDGSEDVPQPIQLDSLKPDNIVIERPRSVTDTKL